MEVDTAIYRPYKEVVAHFTRACWQLVASDGVVTESTRSDDLAMLRHRALSTFEHLTDEEIEDGLGAVERATLGCENEALASRGDLLVFRLG
jgi:hypothetical protein